VSDCANCGAPMRIEPDRGVLVCDHCGSQQEAPALADQLQFGEETSNKCPACAVPLFKSQLAGYALLTCRQCFGLLVEMRQFVAVIEAVRAREGRAARSVPPPRQSPRDQPLMCPTCGEPMIDHVYGGPGNVAIDTCERCLVNWLDPGELRRIAVAPDSSR